MGDQALAVAVSFITHQYFADHKALSHPILHRKITDEEYLDALAAFDEAGFENG